MGWGRPQLHPPPPDTFAGVIGGPPCPSHSSLRGIIRHRGHRPAPDLVPEYLRIVAAAQPDWWLMECTPLVTDAQVEGYQVHRFNLNNRWIGDGFGGEQSRKRAFQFGTHDGARLVVEMAALERTEWEYCCTASEGRRGGKPMTLPKNKRGFRQTMPHRSFPRFCELQGLPADFLKDAPMTKEGRYRMVGNGVPLPMGRALARAIRRARERQEVSA